MVVASQSIVVGLPASSAAIELWVRVVAFSISQEDEAVAVAVEDDSSG